MKYPFMISTALVVALPGIAQDGARLTDKDNGSLVRSALERGQSRVTGA